MASSISSSTPTAVRHWQEMNGSRGKIQAVTAADVQRVAKNYFTKENRTVCTYLAKQAPPTKIPMSRFDQRGKQM